MGPREACSFVAPLCCCADSRRKGARSGLRGGRGCPEASRTVQGDEKLKTAHPAFRDAGETVSQYDFQDCEAPFLKNTTEHLLMSAHLTSVSSVESLSVCVVSERDKEGNVRLPIVLQVRANQAFRKGDLKLFPSGADLVAAGEDAKIKVAKSEGVVHESMLLSVDVTTNITTSPQKRRISGKASSQDGARPSTAQYTLLTPVLAGKASSKRETCLANLAPFWALLRMPSHNHMHNMAIHTVVLKDQSFDDLAGSKGLKPPKTMMTTVEIPYAVNITPISKGQLLTLAFEEKL